MRPVTVLRALGAAALITLPTLAVAGPAAAEPPQQLTEQVTDTAGVLGSGDAQEIQQTIEEVQDATGQLVYVTFVDDFAGAGNEQWAADTANASGLGPNNILLAVGVDVGQFGLGRHSASPVDRQELQNFTDGQVAPLLGDGDWAGAATTFATGVGGSRPAATPAAAGAGAGAAFSGPCSSSGSSPSSPSAPSWSSAARRTTASGPPVGPCRPATR
ncbi:TPM domain-containing protein [Georgenia yuyongxinii]